MDVKALQSFGYARFGGIGNTEERAETRTPSEKA